MDIQIQEASRTLTRQDQAYSSYNTEYTKQEKNIERCKKEVPS
jgi:hypothetical protein